MKIKKYKDIESFLFKQLPMYQRIGPKAFKKNLKNIKALSKAINHPHKAFKSIHIAGTNGKGSTAFLIAAALNEAGYKVGLYTSPHYSSYRERIKVDKEMISKAYVKSFVNKIIDLGLFDKQLRPSFFELTVAMAFNYFKEMEVDYAVIETGLGGRLDSTNIIIPELAVITNIGYDHMNFLGNTLQLIAKEKAGIIKAGVPVVIGRYQKETIEIFKKIAFNLKSDLLYASEISWPEELNQLRMHQPDFKQENMQTAYAAIKTLHPSFDDAHFFKSWTKRLKQWGYLGRYQWISKRPKILVDSAHNKMGIQLLFEQLKKERFDTLHIVLAIVADKDTSVIFPMFPDSAVYYFCQANIPRAMDKALLQSKATKSKLNGKIYSSVRKALAAAKVKAGPKDLILVTGSIFTIAEVV